MVFLLESEIFCGLFTLLLFCRHCSMLCISYLCLYTGFWDCWLILSQHIPLLVVEMIQEVTVFLETQTHLALTAIDAAESWAYAASVSLLLTHIRDRLCFHQGTSNFGCWGKTAPFWLTLRLDLWRSCLSELQEVALRMLWDIHLIAETLVGKPAISTANVHTILDYFQVHLFLDMQVDPA